MKLMSATPTQARNTGLGSRPLRVGFLALTDAAPFVVAEQQNLFTEHGLHVELRREIGWATIRDKIIYGELDAAHAPAPMLWSTRLGLGCSPCEVLTALVLNLNGNALTLSRTLWEAGARDASSLRTYAKDRHQQQALTFGIGFQFSTQHLLLREWLLAAGINPERDVRIVVVPPAQMLRNLSAGSIDGYCAGEPWNTLAVRDGAGWCPTWSAAQSPGHIEKVLMVTSRFAENKPAEHAALVSVLTTACAWCDEPQNREPLAQLLSAPAYLNVPAHVIAPTLLGRFDCGRDRVENVPDFHVFHRGGTNRPSVEKAAAIQAALVAAGLLTSADAAERDLPRQIFRNDLHCAALSYQQLNAM